MVVRFFIAIMFTLSTVHAQNPDFVKNSISYTASIFEKRLPDFAPLKNPKYKNVQIAKINANASIQPLELFWGKDETEKNIFWLIVRLSNDIIKLQMVSFENNIGDKSITKLDVELSEDGLSKASLELCLLSKNNVVLYRWLDANPTSQVAGGTPVFTKSPIYKGGKLPEIVVKSLEKQLVKLNEVNDKIIVINWWSIGCKPCIEEIPGLNKLVENFKNSKIEFIAIAWNNETEVLNFLSTNKFHYHQYVHSEKADSIFGNTFPRNIIVDRNGFVVYDHTGGWADSYLDLQKEIEKIITRKK